MAGAVHPPFPIGPLKSGLTHVMCCSAVAGLYLGSLRAQDDFDYARGLRRSKKMSKEEALYGVFYDAPTADSEATKQRDRERVMGVGEGMTFQRASDQANNDAPDDGDDVVDADGAGDVDDKDGDGDGRGAGLGSRGNTDTDGLGGSGQDPAAKSAKSYGRMQQVKLTRGKAHLRMVYGLGNRIATSCSFDICGQTADLMVLVTIYNAYNDRGKVQDWRGHVLLCAEDDGENGMEEGRGSGERQARDCSPRGEYHALGQGILPNSIALQSMRYPVFEIVN